MSCEAGELTNVIMSKEWIKQSKWGVDVECFSIGWSYTVPRVILYLTRSALSLRFIGSILFGKHSPALLSLRRLSS